MFGMFKKKSENNRDKLQNEFDDIVRQVKSAARERQGLVGRGIQEAEKSFYKKYSKSSFQTAPFSEQMKQVDFIRKMEVEINSSDGPVKIMSIGYALFNRWQSAVISKDNLLIENFEGELRNFKDIANSFARRT
jgi:hypothetical protein